MISIIIPVYNQHDMTYECIQRIREHTTNCEIIIVDNGSNPPAKIPFTGFIECKVIRNKKNEGFPVAVNQGIKASSGEVIILLNNDALVTPGWARRLTDRLNPFRNSWDGVYNGFDIVGPVTNYVAGVQRVNIDPYNNVDELDQSAIAWAKEVEDGVMDVNFIIGFCMAFTRALYDKIGPFDESLWPCSGEEIDFCLRARQAGYSVGVIAGCYVHHEGSQTFKTMDVDYEALCKRNDAHLAETWGEGFWLKQLRNREEEEEKEEARIEGAIL